MSDSKSGIWNLIKSALLPVDTDALRSVFDEIYNDARKTSWLQLLYRLEGVSVLILLPATLILGGIFAYEKGIGFAEIQTIGIQYAIGLALLLIFVVAKVIVWIVQSINNGESIWGYNNDKFRLELSLRLIMSLVFVLGPFYMTHKLNVSIGTLLVFFVLSCILLGSVVAGLCGLFSSILVAKQNYQDPS